MGIQWGYLASVFCSWQVGRLHGSVPNLSRYLESCQNQPIFSLPPEYSQLQRSFWILAQKGELATGINSIQKHMNNSLIPVSACSCVGEGENRMG